MLGSKQCSKLSSELVEAIEKGYPQVDASSAKVAVKSVEGPPFNHQVAQRGFHISNPTINVQNPCEKVITSDQKLWVAMPAWNRPDLLHSSLKSVLSQDIQSDTLVNVVVFEDFSERRGFLYPGNVIWCFPKTC